MPIPCGEIRLIFRLAYLDVSIKTYSRLPMTMQEVRTIRPPCEIGARPAEILRVSDFFDLELNLQSVRWPAGIGPDMGGYAEYIMRVFDKHEGKWRVRPLENSIDPAKLKRSPGLKKELLEWLKSPVNQRLVDQGEAVLPEKFLADKAVSVAVHGLNRSTNRLFGQIFNEKDFDQMDFSTTTYVKSPKGYMRKLDEMTCTGCHQLKSIAGFHFLGKDRKVITDASLKVPIVSRTKSRNRF